jgi:hypothetical protein
MNETKSSIPKETHLTYYKTKHKKKTSTHKHLIIHQQRQKKIAKTAPNIQSMNVRHGDGEQAAYPLAE